MSLSGQALIILENQHHMAVETIVQMGIGMAIGPPEVHFGAVDLAGFPKDRFIYIKVGGQKSAHGTSLPHWNWEGREEESIPVFVYTNTEEVELFLNGKSLGKKVKGKDKTPIPINFIDWEGGRYKGDFLSPYRLMEGPVSKGKLSVKAYDKSKLVAQAERITAGNPAKIRLTPDEIEY